MSVEIQINICSVYTIVNPDLPTYLTYLFNLKVVIRSSDMMSKLSLLVVGSAPILPKDCRTMGCGKLAECVATGDNFACQCPSGMIGNPQIECSPGKSSLSHPLTKPKVFTETQILIPLLYFNLLSPLPFPLYKPGCVTCNCCVHLTNVSDDGNHVVR